VLVAEVSLRRLYPGGPARASFTGRFGPDGDRLGGFELTARDSADIPRMMAEGVDRMDELFTRALAAGVFVHDRSLDIPLPPPPVEEAVRETKPETGPLVSLPLFISASDGTTLIAALGQIRAIAGVEAVTDRSGGGDLVVAYRGALSTLRSGLVARGWTVDLSGGSLRISRGAASPQPAAPASPPPAPAPAPAP
jgi:hypothetical protein